jgi:DNA primase
LWREVEQLTKLRQYGPERAIGHCPFHDDQHPSLSILGGFWRCWAGCGEGGINAFRARARGLERR